MFCPPSPTTNTVDDDKDKEYALRTSLPDLMDELVCYLMDDKDGDPLLGIAQWSVDRLVACGRMKAIKTLIDSKETLPQKRRKTLQENHVVRPFAMFDEMEGALIDGLRGEIAIFELSFKRGHKLKVEDSSKVISRLLNSVQWLCSLYREFLFPLLDAEFQSEASNHLYFESAADLQQRAHDLEIITISITAGGQVTQRILRELIDFSVSFEKFVSHKMCSRNRILETDITLQRSMFIESCTSLRLGDSPVLPITVKYITKCRPHCVLQEYVSAVVDADDENKKCSRQIYAAVMSSSPNSCALLSAEGLLSE